MASLIRKSHQSGATNSCLQILFRQAGEIYSALKGVNHLLNFNHPKTKARYLRHCLGICDGVLGRILTWHGNAMHAIDT